MPIFLIVSKWLKIELVLCLYLNLPIGSENEFEGLVDLVTMKEWIWDSDDLGHLGS